MNYCECKNSVWIGRLTPAAVACSDLVASKGTTDFNSKE